LGIGRGAKLTLYQSTVSKPHKPQIKEKNTDDRNGKDTWA